MIKKEQIDEAHKKWQPFKHEELQIDSNDGD
jgi:hypothetical protein